ncbi:MAG TPA: carbohydrate kinase [Candidatus Limnocylindrales bacterium]|nr:carbohydrate kinase [Candidatus Limnocylindrales bacterium]
MIVVGGESLIDLIVYPDGRLAAISGGGPFNTARTIARLGASAAYLGRLSTDRFGRALLDRLALDGVDCRLVQATDAPTTLAVAELDESGAANYHFYVDGTAAPGLSDEGLMNGPPGAQMQAIHIGTLGLVLEPMATTLEALVASASDGVVVMIDPNCRPSATPDPAALRARVERLAARADVIKVSRDDLRSLFPSLDLERSVAALLNHGPSAVLVTDGGNAVHVVTKGGTTTLPVPRIAVVDTVGAGDAFGGGFLCSWIGRGMGRAELADPDLLQASVEFAIRVASETCRRSGAEPPTAADMVAAV